MIMTMIMMIMTYDHYDDLGSMIMILQNVITTWFKVYCPWPGYLDGGKVNTNRHHDHCRQHHNCLKVLLVGNMCLYDYRPYVKRIKNDRQIIFVCDKARYFHAFYEIFVDKQNKSLLLLAGVQAGSWKCEGCHLHRYYMVKFILSFMVMRIMMTIMITIMMTMIV